MLSIITTSPFIDAYQLLSLVPDTKPILGTAARGTGSPEKCIALVPMANSNHCYFFVLLFTGLLFYTFFLLLAMHISKFNFSFLSIFCVSSFNWEFL